MGRRDLTLEWSCLQTIKIYNDRQADDADDDDGLEQTRRVSQEVLKSNDETYSVYRLNN